MTALRQLSAIYLATAGAFVVAMTMSAHPAWQKKAEIAGHFLRVQGTATAVALDEHVLRPGWKLALKEGAALDRRIVASFPAPHAPIVHVAKTVPAQHPPVLASNPAPTRQEARVEAPTRLRGDEAAAPTSHMFTLAPPVATPPVPADSGAPASIAPAAPADLVAVEQRLKDNLTGEMLANFELFLYVSKADAGPWAQHMYVFQKQASGDLVLLYNWPVSTGREKVEFNPAGRQLTTLTPQGYYELDPNRSYEHYRSAEWGQPMPYAMFFNWIKDGNPSGLAIHAASGDDVARLGQRASAGCIHLSEDNARTLFTMIRSQYRGLAPRFAIDRRTGTMSNDGILLHDKSGQVRMADGYKVLVFIENYGGENVVAALF